MEAGLYVPSAGPGLDSLDELSVLKGSPTLMDCMDMAAFGFDLEPLPSYLSFSPNYKDYGAYGRSEKSPHDVADVLLSLKHAVLHPGATTGGQISPGSHHGNYTVQPGLGTVGGQPQPTTPNLSYSIYPQIQVTSNGNALHPNQIYCPTSEYVARSPGLAPCPGTGQPGSTAATMTFPASMSVNLSMNMTMGVPTSYVDPQFHATSPQWNSCQYGGSANNNNSASYGSAAAVSPYPISPTNTYTFTAEFRPEPVEKDYSTFKAYTGSKTAETGSCLLTVKQPKPRPVSSHHHHPRSPSYEDQLPGSPVGRTNLCRVCGKTYARPSTLKTHMRTHSGERPYRCQTCNKSFSQAANLTAHIRTHSGEKPFRCPVCDRRFSQSSSVTTHMRTHSGERPYRCCLCKKAFSDSSTLTKHLRIHSGEKPYQCKLCLLRFSQSGNLNRHMRVHAGAP